MLKYFGILAAAAALVGVVAVATATAAPRPVALGSPAAQAACDAARSVQSPASAYTENATLLRATTASAAAIAGLSGGGKPGGLWDTLKPSTLITVCVYSGQFAVPAIPGGRTGHNRLVVLVTPDGQPWLFQAGWDDNMPSGASLP